MKNSLHNPHGFQQGCCWPPYRRKICRKTSSRIYVITFWPWLFYFVGREDEVECVFCKVKVNNWTAEMDPLRTHIQKHPPCPLVQGKTSRKDSKGTPLRAGTSMKNQVLVGYWVFKKIQVRVKSGSGPRKTLPENTCITSKVIHRHKGLEYVSTTTPYFPWPQHFIAFLSCDELQINQYCLWDWQVPQLT